MFEDSLLESAGRIRTRRGLTAATSLALQSLLLAMLVLLPLFYTEGLPARLWLANRVFVPPPPPSGGPATLRVARAAASDIWEGHLRMPTHIPSVVANIVEEHAPPTGPAIGVPYGTSEESPDGVLHTILTPEAASPPVPPHPPMRRLRVSQGVVEGLLVHQVKPAYPDLAIQTHTQGDVVLHAIIGRDGTIAGLQVVSGHPLLAPAAVAAVQEWRYRPYTLNGEPVEVETLITVRFVLGD
jgi:protein TonB